MDILQLIEELEDELDDANGLPFSKKVSVDPERISVIIKDIRSNLPEEIRQAKWVNDERDRILAEAQQQAQEILQDAQKKAQDADQEMQRRFEQLVNEHQITKMATEKGQQIVSQAENTASSIKSSTFAYVDEILAQTQERLRSVVQELDANRSELH